MNGQVPVLCNERVLLFEDDEHLAKRLRIGLEAWGYGVAIARNRTEALRLATAAPFDAVVLDLGVSTAKGLMLLTALRERHSSTDVPVIALSETPQACSAALYRGAHTCISRSAATPFCVAQVIRHVTSNYLPVA